jgi:hypothetical protein
MFVVALPIFVGYYFVRPRLVGADPGEFWSGEDDNELWLPVAPF